MKRILEPETVNLWEDPRSTYNEKKKDDGRIKISGDLYVDSVKYHFSLTQSRDDRKIMRGNMYIMARSTLGKLKGADGNDTRYQLKVSGTRKDIIQPYIFSCVTKMSVKYQAEIEADLNNLKLDLVPIGRAFSMFGSDSIMDNYRKTSDKSLNANIKLLTSLAAALGSKPMGQITCDDLLDAYEHLTKSSRDKATSCAKHFWAYCQKVGAYKGSNPFAVFDRLVDKPRDPNGRYHSMAPEAIPEQIEANFVTFFRQKDTLTADDIGLVLAHDGFNSAQIKSIKVTDLICDTIIPGSVCVPLIKGGTGATHNFTRPLSPFAAEMVKRYLEETGLKSGLLVTGTTVSTAEYAKTTLIKLGMDAREMRADAESIYGVGIDLLYRNHKRWLINHCGLANDQGAVCYLCYDALPDTTSDHYRSFSRFDGQRALLAHMEQDKRFSAPSEELMTITTDDSSGETDVNVPAKYPGRYNTITLVVDLPPNGRIDLDSKVCLEGILEVLNDLGSTD